MKHGDTGIKKLLQDLHTETGAPDEPKPIIVFECPGGPDAHGKALEILQGVPLPKEIMGDDDNLHVSVYHIGDCPGGEGDTDNCTCEKVWIEAIPLTPFEVEVVERMGAYDFTGKADLTIVVQEVQKEYDDKPDANFN